MKFEGKREKARRIKKKTKKGKRQERNREKWCENREFQDFAFVWTGPYSSTVPWVAVVHRVLQLQIRTRNCEVGRRAAT